MDAVPRARSRSVASTRQHRYALIRYGILEFLSRGKIWCPRQDSNLRPALRNGAALSTELRGHSKPIVAHSARSGKWRKIALLKTASRV